MENQSEPDRVITETTETLEDCPDDVDALCLRGWAWLQKKDYTNAIADFDKALCWNASRVDALHNQGRAYSERGEFDLAIKNFDEAFRHGPSRQELIHLHHNRGIARYHKSAYLDAIEDFNKAIDLAPQHAKALRMRGLSWYGRQDYEEAIRDFDRAIRLDPQSPTAFHNRGNALAEAGKYRRAIADFTRSLKLDPDDAKTHNSRGVAWNRKGRHAKAVADYERALELDPDNPLRHFVLGGFLAVCPDGRFRDGHRAVELTTNACELTDFQNAEYLNILAAAHAENGDFTSAIEVLQQSLEIADGDDKEDALFCLDLYKAGQQWRMDPPTWRERLS